MLTLLLSSSLLFAADTAVYAGARVSPAATDGQLGAVARTDSGLQLGVEARAGAAQALYLDGWPVSAGSLAEVEGLLVAPVTHTDRLQLDLQARLGGYGLWAAETAAPQDRSAGAGLTLTPLATIPVAPSAAVQLGWSAVFRYQLAPGFSTDALGQVVVLGAAVGLSEQLQLSARGETGGMFGYDGDGAKYLTRGTLSLRWMPQGTAKTWLNL